MSFSSSVSAATRAVLIAAATGAAAFGLLVVLHPFVGPTLAPPAIGTPASDAIEQQIETTRDALRRTEAAVAALSTSQSSTLPNPSAQLDAQIAATTERRNLAQRHAEAIRVALKAHTDLNTLAEIRDSTVIGQFLARLSTLEATIAEQRTHFKPNHPIMRALTAQRAALLVQINNEAANIATSLETEAKLDDAQVKQLQTQRSAIPVTTDTGLADLTSLQAQAAAQRAALDALMDSYFGLPHTTPAPRIDPILSALSPLNLFVAAIAALAALAAQIGFALRRRRLRLENDLTRWRHDRDLENAPEPVVATVLRHAS